MSLNTAIRDEMDNWSSDEQYCTYLMANVIPEILESIDKPICISWLRQFSDNLKRYLHNEKSLLYFIYKKERGLPAKETFPFTTTIEEAEKQLERVQLKIQRAIYMRQKLRELGIEVEKTMEIDEEDILESMPENLVIIGHHDVEQGEEKALEEEDMELTGQTIPPLRTEEEYVEELKNIELEMIKVERNIETKRHFIFGKRGKNQEDEGKEDITEKMMQMYLELSEVADVTKTNKIQHIYNRIIRSLKRMPDIDDSKIPPTLKEMVVQRVETPLPNAGNVDGNIEIRETQRTGENVGEDGPSMK